MRHLIFGNKYILNNSLFINNVAQTVTMNGTVTRTTDHKGGNTAIQFGSGNLVSMNNLPASPVWSISFWVKNIENITQYQTILNTQSSSAGIINIPINKNAANRLSAISSNTAGGAYSERGVAMPPINTWNHVVLILNRAESGVNENKFYINKVLTKPITVAGTEQTGNFVSAKLEIAPANVFKGATSPIKMFNYALTQTEIDNLYNE